MNINQPYTYPTFKAKGIPLAGQQHAFGKSLGTFTISSDSLAKIRTIADKCWEMNTAFYNNKSILPNVIKHFGEDVFTKEQRRTYSLNSILSNFKLLLRIPTLYTKTANNELFTFIIGKKEENDTILRVHVNGNGRGELLTCPEKYDKEAPETIETLKKDPNNTTYLDTILNAIKEIYDYFSSIYYRKQDTPINPKKLEETLSNLKDIKSINKQYSKTWGTFSKLDFLKQNPDIKYNRDTQLFVYNKNYSYYFNVLDGQKSKDFLKIMIYDSPEHVAKTFIIKPNSEIYTPKNKNQAYSMSDDKYITLASDEDIKKYDLENIFNSINDYANRYKVFMEDRHANILNKKIKRNTPKQKRKVTPVQTIQLEKSETESIICTLDKLRTRLSTKNFTQKRQLQKDFYNDIPRHSKSIVFGIVPNTKNHYSCNLDTKDSTKKLAINVYDDNDKMLNSFAIDENGKFYILKNINIRSFSNHNLKLISDEEICNNHLVEICKDAKTTAENYLNYIDSNEEVIPKIPKNTPKVTKKTFELVTHKTYVAENTTKQNETEESKIVTKTAKKTKHYWVDNKELYEKLTRIFNTDVDKRSDKIIKVFGSNGKVIPAIFEYKTSDNSTIRIMKAITNWGIDKTNYCIKVTNNGKTYYYRINNEQNSNNDEDYKIIECDEQGHILLQGNKQLKYINKKEYLSKYPFMAKMFPKYVKEILNL